MPARTGWITAKISWMSAATARRTGRISGPIARNRRRRNAPIGSRPVRKTGRRRRCHGPGGARRSGALRHGPRRRARRRHEPRRRTPRRHEPRRRTRSARIVPEAPRLAATATAADRRLAASEAAAARTRSPVIRAALRSDPPAVGDNRVAAAHAAAAAADVVDKAENRRPGRLLASGLTSMTRHPEAAPWRSDRDHRLLSIVPVGGGGVDGTARRAATLRAGFFLA